ATVEAEGKLSFSGEKVTLRLQALEVHNGPPMMDAFLAMVPTELVGPLAGQAKALDGKMVDIKARLVAWDPPRKIVLCPTSITAPTEGGAKPIDLGSIKPIDVGSVKPIDPKSKGLVPALGEAEPAKPKAAAGPLAGPPEETHIGDGQSMASIAK